MGVVDAGKGLEALGAGLSGPGPQDHLIVEDDGDARQVLRGAPEGVQQVDLGVRRVEADGFLCAGEDDGLGAALHQIAEGRRRVGHGIRTVGHHEAVVGTVVLPDAPGDHQPVLRLHVGAV